MKNADILKRLFSPINAEGHQFWHDFLKQVNDDALWEPNSDGTFHHLNYKFSLFDKNVSEPSFHLVSASIPNQNVFELIEGRKVFLSPNVIIKPMESIELIPQGWDYTDEVKFEHLRFGEALSISFFQDNEKVVDHLLEIAGGLMGKANDKFRDEPNFISGKLREIVEHLAKNPWARLLGRIFLLKVALDEGSELIHKHIIAAFLQDTVILKLLVVEGGLKLGVIN